MNIETERLIIRPLRYEDYSGYFSIYNDRETAVMAGVRPLYNIDQARMFVLNLLANYKVEILTIIQKESGKIIGTLSVFWINNYSGIEIGYTIIHTLQRRGYAKEAVKGYLKAFKSKYNKYVQAVVSDLNIPSKSFVKSLGFKLHHSYIDKEGKSITVYWLLN